MAISADCFSFKCESRFFSMCHFLALCWFQLMQKIPSSLELFCALPILCPAHCDHLGSCYHHHYHQIHYHLRSNNHHHKLAATYDNYTIIFCIYFFFFFSFSKIKWYDFYSQSVFTVVFCEPVLSALSLFTQPSCCQSKQNHQYKLGQFRQQSKVPRKNIKCIIFSPWQRCCNALLEQKKKQRNIKTRCNDKAHPRCHSMTVIVKTSSFFDATKESWSVISDYVLHIFIPNNTLNHKTCSMKILNWSPCVTTTT